MMKLFAFASVATLVGAQECPNIPDTTLDLLYDVVQIQAVAQASLVDDIMALCAITGASCTSAPGRDVASALTLTLSPDYAATLADGAAGINDDCYLSPAEIAADADAAAMVAAFQQTVANNLGVPASTVVITGVHTDGDSAQGCTTGTVQSQFAVGVNPSYYNTLVDGLSAGALADCYISAAEMAADPQVGALAQAIAGAQAGALGVDSATLTVTGVHTDGDAAPGCQTGRRNLLVPDVVRN